MTVTIWDQEAAKAILYRDQWDARIAFRANQLRRFSGSREAFRQLWDNYRAVYDRTNYIEGQPEEDFLTPYDIDDDGSISASTVRLPHTRHAGDSQRVV
jgi:hypothetical protein